MNTNNCFFAALWLCISLFSSMGFATISASKATTLDKQTSLTPKRALELLKEGNQRFTTGQMRDYNFSKEKMITTQNGQFPIAVVLSCIDSRSIPDILFDQGLGNLFVSRIAGNVVDRDLLGSMEFATHLAGAPLVVIMGHTHCGAVQGACNTKGDTGLKNLDFLLSKIKPAVSQIKQDASQFNCENYTTVDVIARQNVLNQMSTVLAQSPQLASMVAKKEIYLIGAMHDLATGKVTFFDATGKAL